MKRMINRLIKDEKGLAFPLVLILLVLGVLIIAPLLNFMGTGLNTGQAYERRMHELYAADSGVEYALHQIITVDDNLPQADETTTYSIANVNDKEVDVIDVTNHSHGIYQIVSTATSADTSTTIESYVQILSLANFMDNSITSRGRVRLQPKVEVYGDPDLELGDVVYSPGTKPPSQDQVEGSVVREITEDEIDAWPTAEFLQRYYLLVQGIEGIANPWDQFADKEIDLNGVDTAIPTLYRVGNLTVKNTQAGDPRPILTLNGTVFITGDLTFRQPGGNRDYELRLNGNTIFVLGDIKFPAEGCHLRGSGCIIAVGDIDFQPRLESWGGPPTQDFTFVMSVEGEVSFQPNGDFYGSIAGNVEVNLQPGMSLRWNGPPPILKYPGAEAADINVVQAIRTWEISLQ